MSSRKPAYITTPIYYVNDRPHIGHAYTTTLCDVWARAMRLDGREVFFLTGTDEHGAKVEKSAKERGVTPQALADENSAEFRQVLALQEAVEGDANLYRQTPFPNRPQNKYLGSKVHRLH